MLRWKHLGVHSFGVASRTGEYVTLAGDNGIGQTYRVKAIIHPLDPAANAGDLTLEYASTDVEPGRSL
jgi:ABC-type branched-subunit amino acid transport system ATPase component